MNERRSAEHTALRWDAAIDRLEHITLRAEQPVAAVTRSHRLNPLPHAGTISVFLLGVVTVTGLYITLFYEFGFEASYESVQRMEQHAIQKIVRAVHRYSSAALVVTTLVHAWRVFVARRFVGGARPRRWVHGVAALGLVWLAGVSGYWLVWDRRAQAVADVVVDIAASLGLGGSSVIRTLAGSGDSSGSAIMLAVWFLHLGLTAAIGYFTWKHLRRTKLAWLPPAHWMAMMGGALVVGALLLPVGMLAPADPSRLVESMPLDPFVLFLLPPLLTDWWLVGVAGILAALLALSAVPRVLTRRAPAAAVVDPNACTGCELCVVDCPYDALTMSTQFEADDGRATTIAVVANDACVGCGICLGSCAFGAIDVPGVDTAGTALPLDGVSDRTVVAVCERHVMHSPVGGVDEVVVPVRCAGVVPVSVVRQAMEAGAAAVHTIGCAPADCRYGIGNELAAERMRGDRAPHPPRRWSDKTATSWVGPLELEEALARPELHDHADRRSIPVGRERLIGAALVVAASVGAVALATRAPFAGQNGAQVRVVFDHEPGAVLDETGVALGAIDQVRLVLDGVTEATRRLDGDTAGLIDWEVDPASTSEVEVVVATAAAEVTYRPDTSTFGEGSRLIVDVADVPPEPGISDGRAVFGSRAAGCTVCHSVREGDDGVGPSLYGVATAAATRVEGLSAELYLRQSILLPDEYVVDGWPAGQMLPIYRDALDEEELQALITYLLSLEATEAAADQTNPEAAADQTNPEAVGR